MSERDFVPLFESSDDFITHFSHSSMEVRKFEENKELVSLFVQGEPVPGEGGRFSQRFTRGEIKQRLHQSGRIKKPDSLLGKIGLAIQLRRPLQTNYWKRYHFECVGEEKGDDTVYTMTRTDAVGW